MKENFILFGEIIVNKNRILSAEIEFLDRQGPRSWGVLVRLEKGTISDNTIIRFPFDERDEAMRFLENFLKELNS